MRRSTESASAASYSPNAMLLHLDGTTRTAIAAFVLLTIAVFIGGCSEWPPPADRAEAMAEAVLPSVSASQDNPEMRVYVDCSLSMAPYTSADASPYRTVLQATDNLFGGTSSFFCFGFPSKTESQVVQPVRTGALLSPDAYGYVNNDYGILFQNFLPDDGQPSTTHIVMSDGVQSSPTGGARFARIVDAIGAWVHEGGIFALLTYRTPYRGTYYNEVPQPGQVTYNCGDRPIHLFGFFPSPDALDSFVEVMETEVTADYRIRVGLPAARLMPTDELADAPIPSGGLHKPRDVTSYLTPDVTGDVNAGIVTGGGSLTSLTYGVRFDPEAAPWSTVEADVRRQIFSSADVTLTAHQIANWAGGPADTLSVTPLPDDGIRLMSDPEWAVVNDSLVTYQFPVDVSFPKSGRNHVALDVQLGLSPNGANRLVPGSLSTQVDADPRACSRTLNLGRTLGAILRNHYIVGRSLTFLQWTTGAGS